MAGEAGKKRDEAWLRKLLAGDDEAFAEFVDKYKSKVFLCCRTLGLKEDEAEDVASETFLAAYKGIRQYRGQAKLSTWLWRIAYHQGVNYLRKKRRKWQLLAEPEEQPGSRQEQGPEAAVVGKEEGEMVWDAVERLPGLWAMAIVLFYREEKNVKEVAKIMRVRQNTVKTYLFRGRKKLKGLLTGALGEDIDVGG